MTSLVAGQVGTPARGVEVEFTGLGAAPGAASVRKYLVSDNGELRRVLPAPTTPPTLAPSLSRSLAPVKTPKKTRPPTTAFRASRGGDGGCAPAADSAGDVIGGAVNRAANKRELLTAAPRQPLEGGAGKSRCLIVPAMALRGRIPLVPTACPFDHCHGVMDFRGYYVPAALFVAGSLRKLPQARPRRYPKSGMASDSRGAPTVGYDSVLDATYEAQKRLAGVPGIGVGGGEEVSSEMLHPRNRDLLRRRAT